MKPEKRKCGFAVMDPEKVREIASKGGRTAHARGVAHQWQRGEEASAAGRKGQRMRVERQKAKS